MCAWGPHLAEDAGRLAALESRVAEPEKQPDFAAAAVAARAFLHARPWQHLGSNQISGTTSCGSPAKNGSWPLAAYELDELQEGLDDAVKYHPTHEKVPEPLERLVPRYTSSAMQQLHAAVDAKDKIAFAKAFDALTAGCNQCHEASSFGFNVVKRPTVAPVQQPGLHAEAMTAVADHETFMRLALEQARLAADAGEVPIGAVAVAGGDGRRPRIQPADWRGRSRRRTRRLSRCARPRGRSATTG